MDRKELVKVLKKAGYIKTKSVEQAFLAVPRENFVPQHYREVAYSDTPLSIGFAQTISAPSMIAIMLERAELEKNQKVLEIGAGSGYNAALISHIVGAKNVVTIERIPELVEFARANLQSINCNCKILCGDGTLGYRKNAPYDRIIVTAAAPQISKCWKEQLTENGKIIAPVGSSWQKLIIVEKKHNKFTEKEDCSCVFVPLIGRYGF